MKRNDFLTKPLKHLFWPSVKEIWRDKRDGRELLLLTVYEPHGFHCTYFNCDGAINFNHLPEDWLDSMEYVKTIADEEIQKLLKSKKERGW